MELIATNDGWEVKLSHGTVRIKNPIDKYNNYHKLIYTSNAAINITFEIPIYKSDINLLFKLFKQYSSFSSETENNLVVIQDLLKDYNWNGDTLVDKINCVLEVIKNINRNYKNLDEDRRKLLREKSELEYKEKQLKQLLQNSGDIIEGTNLSDLSIEDALRRLLNERRNAQLALAGIYSQN